MNDRRRRKPARGRGGAQHRGPLEGDVRPRRRASQERRDGGAALEPERMVYGRHPVREAVAGQREVLAAHVTEQALRDVGDALEGVPVTVTDVATLTALAGTADHQGVVAEVAPFPYCDPHDLLDGHDAALPVVFCLDQVTDPHNLGAIARVCDATGAAGLLVPEHRSAHVTAAVSKASAGAIEHVRVARCTNLADTIARLKGARVWAYAASERGERLYTDVDYGDAVLLVLGSEGTGVRPRVLDQCDEIVRLPMHGTVSSLNVSTVAAVLAYECLRQQRAREGNGSDGPGSGD